MIPRIPPPSIESTRKYAMPKQDTPLGGIAALLIFPALAGGGPEPSVPAENGSAGDVVAKGPQVGDPFRAAGELSS